MIQAPLRFNPRWRPALAQSQEQAPIPNVMKQIPVPPFGLPMLPSGIILVALGAVTGGLGSYLAIKGSKVIGKKIPTFWEWYFGVGGIGVTLSILGAIPLVLMGTIEIIGDYMINKGINDINKTIVQGVQQMQTPAQK